MSGLIDLFFFLASDIQIFSWLNIKIIKYVFMVMFSQIVALVASSLTAFFLNGQVIQIQKLA